MCCAVSASVQENNPSGLNQPASSSQLGFVAAPVVLDPTVVAEEESEKLLHRLFLLFVGVVDAVVGLGPLLLLNKKAGLREYETKDRVCCEAPTSVWVVPVGQMGQRCLSKKGPSSAMLRAAAARASLMLCRRGLAGTVRSRTSRLSLRRLIRCWVSTRRMRRRLKQAWASSEHEVRGVDVVVVVVVGVSAEKRCSEEARGRVAEDIAVR